MSAAGFAAVDHPADLALRVWAGDRGELFRQAARGLATELWGTAPPTATRETTLAVTGLDAEELLVAWLGEILYVLERDRLALTDFERPEIAAESEGLRLSGRARGFLWDPERRTPRVEIKAPTYHRLAIVPDRQGRFDVTIVFDT